MPQMLHKFSVVNCGT